MKVERADVVVGATVLGALGLVAAVVVWTAGTYRHDTYPLYAQFTDITGIAEQGGVFLRGYEIGRIREIRPVVAEDGMFVFRVRMDVRWSLAGGEARALPVGTTALLKPPPLIGAAYIELRLPDEPARPRLQPGDMIPGFTEPPLTQQAAQLSGGMVFDVTHTLQGAREMMDSLVQATAAAQQLLAASAQALPVLLRGLELQLGAAGELMAELRRDAALLTPGMIAALDSTHLVVADSRALMRELAATIDETRPDLQMILGNLESTTLVLDYFTRTVAERPTRMFTGVRLPSIDSLRRASPRRLRMERIDIP
jgi:ABC-type transporter Mla subunit MlaD